MHPLICLAIIIGLVKLQCMHNYIDPAVMQILEGYNNLFRKELNYIFLPRPSIIVVDL